MKGKTKKKLEECGSGWCFKLSHVTHEHRDKGSGEMNNAVSSLLGPVSKKQI